MTRATYLGIDIGTSVAKATAIDSAGRVLAQRFSIGKYSSSSPSGSEHDPEGVWWSEFLKVTAQVISKIDPNSVESLAVTGMIPNLAPISKSGSPLHNGLLFYDNRAYELEQSLDKELNSARWQNEVLSKLIWLKGHMGARWADVHKVLTTHSYIVYKLTGNVTVDVVTAIEAGSVYSPRPRDWNHSVLHNYGLSSSIFPQVSAPLAVAGELTAHAAELLGLRQGIPVAVGTGDTISTILGAGLRNCDEMLIYYGTYNCSALLTSDIHAILAGNISANPINWTATIPRSGQQLSQLAQQLFPSQSPYQSLSKFDEAAAKSRPGAGGVMFIQTLDFPTSTVSTVPLAAIANFGVNNNISDICRAVLEAFGYGLRYSYEVLGNQANAARCYAAGGGARSPIWKQVISDITGLEQIYLPAADRGLGSAILAGLVVEPDFLREIDQTYQSEAEVVHPNSEHAEVYQRRFEEYCDFLSRHQP